MQEEQNPWKILSKQTAYNNNWIEVVHHEVLNPSGNKGIYGVVKFKNLAIGIIPLDENNNTWIVGQYRFPLNLYSWEIPEGGGKLDTDPLESAKRELIEECGIEAKEWIHILTMHLSNSVSDEVSHVYVARNLNIVNAQPEETEQLVIKKIPFSELFNMVLNGIVTDAISVAAVLKLKHLIDLGKL
ncbi:MAG: NUDIX domain-containing protein [Bacteroidia bacterium]